MKRKEKKKRWLYLRILLAVAVVLVSVFLVIQHKKRKANVAKEIPYQVVEKDLELGDNIFSMYVHNKMIYYAKS